MQFFNAKIIKGKQDFDRVFILTMCCFVEIFSPKSNEYVQQTCTGLMPYYCTSDKKIEFLGKNFLRKLGAQSSLLTQLTKYLLQVEYFSIACSVSFRQLF